jgi:hypothetical protein
MLHKQKYEYETITGQVYDCGESLEMVQRIAKEQGQATNDLEFKPEVRSSDAAGKLDVVVTFKEKSKIIRV